MCCFSRNAPGRGFGVKSVHQSCSASSLAGERAKMWCKTHLNYLSREGRDCSLPGQRQNALMGPFFFVWSAIWVSFGGNEVSSFPPSSLFCSWAIGGFGGALAFKIWGSWGNQEEKIKSVSEIKGWERRIRSFKRLLLKSCWVALRNFLYIYQVSDVPSPAQCLQLCLCASNFKK